ncbi:hypothetical protein IQ07DRAFT_608278 [Pyrenochaeta sp. DS3sAY3a]|nr:hypothetical protein IQ07DRAFT_608278 [Pyrenochaeta sp. DS3sAY3a]
MNSSNLKSRRPLEINSIDHIIRCYGGRTVASEMDPGYMQHSKRPEDLAQYISYLNRRNGELRLEITFYRQCFEHSQALREKLSSLSQDLLHECIIGMLDDAAFEDIKNISKSISLALDNFAEDQQKAFDAFIAPYVACRRTPRPGISLDGPI